MNLRVDLLPQVFALLGSVRLDDIYAWHLIDCLRELLWAVAIGWSQVSTRGVREVGAAAVAVCLAVLGEVPR